MNQKEFNEVIVRQTDHCKSMLVVKGAEYAPRAVKNTAVDRLAHFKSRPESYSFILSPWNEILGYEVNSHNVQDVGAAALCAEVLYEMTFF